MSAALLLMFVCNSFVTSSTSLVIVFAVCKCIGGCLVRDFVGIRAEYYKLLPMLCNHESNEIETHLARDCTITLGYMSQAMLPLATVPACLEAINQVSKSGSWKARASVLELLQVTSSSLVENLITSSYTLWETTLFTQNTIWCCWCLMHDWKAIHQFWQFLHFMLFHVRHSVLKLLIKPHFATFMNMKNMKRRNITFWQSKYWKETFWRVNFHSEMFEFPIASSFMCWRKSALNHFWVLLQWQWSEWTTHTPAMNHVGN